MRMTPPPHFDTTAGMERTRGSWLIWLAVACGLLLRGYHYARGPAVWHDEAAMIVNVIRLPLADSLGPLIHDEASPPLFLLLEKAVVAVLGDGEYALRLVPFVAACAAVLFTALAARRLMSPVWAAVAVGLVAVSDRLLFHACEAKWYSLDVCVAAAAIWAVVATARWPAWRRCLLGAVVAPVGIWLSFPACFVFGGVLVALLPAAWRGGWGGRAAYLAFAAAVLVSFGLLAVGPAKAQRTKKMEDCWTAESGSFADWSQPARVPVWAVANTFEVVRYAFHPYGWPLLLPVVGGALAWWRRPGGRAVACAALLPMLLAFVAACLGKYPYLPARTTAFLAPALALAAAEGLRLFWDVCQPYRLLRWGYLIVWVPVLLTPALYTARRVPDVWERAACDTAAADLLARRQPGEPVYANHWEFDYYLRSLEPGALELVHQYLPGVEWDEWSCAQTAKPSHRWWVVHVEDVSPDAGLYRLPPGFEVKGEKRFRGVLLIEVGPADPTD